MHDRVETGQPGLGFMFSLGTSNGVHQQNLLELGHSMESSIESIEP